MTYLHQESIHRINLAVFSITLCLVAVRRTQNANRSEKSTLFINSCVATVKMKKVNFEKRRNNYTVVEDFTTETNRQKKEI